MTKESRSCACNIQVTFLLTGLESQHVDVQYLFVLASKTHLQSYVMQVCAFTSHTCGKKVKMLLVNE